MKILIEANKPVKNANVFIMGITFKENCPDIRNSKTGDIAKRLKAHQINVQIVDPVADKEDVQRIYQIEMTKLQDVREADCIIFAVAHNEFRTMSYKELDAMYKEMPFNKNIIIDVKSIFNKEELEKKGYIYWSL
ncbi:UDP binding domain-containing protein [Thermotalea metallivorans]|nr:UDP binding domain-containing protein [Thermotalea metallivorans]